MIRTIILLLSFVLVVTPIFCEEEEDCPKLTINKVPQSQVHKFSESKFEKNVGVDPESPEMFRSAISYTQGEKDKRFNATLKIKLNNHFRLNIGLESTEILEDVGNVEFLNLVSGDKDPKSTGGRISLGFTWSSLYKRLIKAFRAHDIFKIIRDAITPDDLRKIFSKREDLTSQPHAVKEYDSVYYENLREVVEIVQCEMIKKLKKNAKDGSVKIVEERVPYEFGILPVDENKKTKLPPQSKSTDDKPQLETNTNQSQKVPLKGKDKINNPYEWEVPTLNAFIKCSSVDDIKEKLVEIKKKILADLKSVATTDDNVKKRLIHLRTVTGMLKMIEIQMNVLKKKAMNSALKKIDTDLIPKKDLPETVVKRIDSKLENLVMKNVLTATLNGNFNYTAIDFHDPEAGFEKKSDSETSFGWQAKLGYFLNPKFVLGVSIARNRIWTAPKADTIIQQFTQGDPPEPIPDTLKSTNMILGPLEKQIDWRIRADARYYILDFFAVNPFARFIINDENKAGNRNAIGLNLLFSFDKERNWLVGIQPICQWKKVVVDENAETKTYKWGKVNFGIGLILSKTFKIAPPTIHEPPESVEKK